MYVKNALFSRLPRLGASRVMLALVALFFALPALAHFSQNLVVRAFLVAEEEGATIVYQDVPVPMLFSDFLQDINALPKDDPKSHIYGDTQVTQGNILLSLSALEQDRDAFETRLKSNLEWRVAGSDNPLEVELLDYRIIAESTRVDWASAEDAKADISGPDEVSEDPEISRATIQFALRLPVAGKQIHTVLAVEPLRLPDGIQIENHVRDLRFGRDVVFAQSGQLEDTLTVSPGLVDRFVHFTWQGVLHVFTGLDHVFLILCVALGPLAIGPLIWRLTGFTIGHSVTLIASAMGWVVTGATFIAWVEFAIAVSIIYAGIEALRGRAPSAIALIAVGLIHGFGFASVLSVILGPGAPAFVASLLAFNVGIEIAQVVIVLIALAVLWIIRKGSKPAETWVRTIALIGFVVMAILWSIEKLPLG